MTIEFPSLKSQDRYPTEILKAHVAYLNRSLKDYIPYGNAVNGQFGIEIELESPDMFPDSSNLRKYWTPHQDGSLRGNGIEYVSRVPFDMKTAVESVVLLKNALEASGTRLPDSYRTSTHVHYNVRNHSFAQVLHHFIAYLIAEPLILRLAGPTRDGNLFCLPYYDLKNIPIWVRNAFVNLISGHPSVQASCLATEKYAAFNMDPVTRFGSVEYRMFKATVDPEKIQGWLQMISNIDDYGLALAKKSNVEDLIIAIYNKPDTFINRIFGGCVDWSGIHDAAQLIQLGCQQAHEVSLVYSNFVQAINKELAARESSSPSVPKVLKVRKKST